MKNKYIELEYPKNLIADMNSSDRKIEYSNKGLEYALSCLTDLQQDIILKYYKERKTYKVISEELIYTPEHICKVKLQVIEKLRNYKLYRYIIGQMKVPQEGSVSYIYDRHIIEMNSIGERTYKTLMRKKLDTPRKILQYMDIKGPKWMSTIVKDKSKVSEEIKGIINPILKQLSMLEVQ